MPRRRPRKPARARSRDSAPPQLRGLDNLTLDGRQRLLRALVDEIIVREDAFEIHGVLPAPGRGQRSDDLTARPEHQLAIGIVRCLRAWMTASRPSGVAAIRRSDESEPARGPPRVKT